MSDSLHLVCTSCQAVNRVPTAKLSQNPGCGKCHQSLFNGQPLELTTSAFNKHISLNDIPVLVDFWAPWCGPCKMMSPALLEATGMLEPQACCKSKYGY